MLVWISKRLSRLAKPQCEMGLSWLYVLCVFRPCQDFCGILIHILSFSDERFSVELHASGDVIPGFYKEISVKEISSCSEQNNIFQVIRVLGPIEHQWVLTRSL